MAGWFRRILCPSPWTKVASLAGVLGLGTVLFLGHGDLLLAQNQQRDAAPRPLEQAERFGGTYRRPLENAPGTLDPARVNDIYARTISQQIFDGLVQYDESLGIKPAIAETWKSSRDGRTWTFSLRKGVKFHHGREVTAGDFVYSFSRLLDPKLKSAAAQFFIRIEGAREFSGGKAPTVRGLKALDRYTLQIRLTDASSPFVSLLAIGYAKVVPRELIESPGNNFDVHPVGTGPFKATDVERNKQVVLEANSEYFLGRPYLDRIEYKIFPGVADEEMFLQFEMMALEDSPVPAKTRPLLLQDNRFQFIRRPIMGIRFLAFNAAQHPLNDRRVREAINHAVDREWIAREIYQGKYSPAGGILPPGTYSYDPKLVAFRYDPAKSKRLLAEAGYPDGKGLASLAIWSAAKSEDAVAELEAIVRYLGAAGIRAEIHYNTDWPSFKRDVYAGKLPIFRYSWYGLTPDPENFLYRLFHSQSVDNFTRLHSPQVDSLLLRASAEPNQIRRVNNFREAEREILNEAPILLLGYYSYERVFQPYVQGIKVSPFGDPYIPMKDIWLDKKAEPHVRR
ncbi:MAG: ABC transporter substrate-binding protein [candidate division NC10 bacterium]|nr:ABC transporter substrate-binding protein [candidate division NC10 bacterium]